jgi:hypothetical protein
VTAVGHTLRLIYLQEHIHLQRKCCDVCWCESGEAVDVMPQQNTQTNSYIVTLEMRLEGYGFEIPVRDAQYASINTDDTVTLESQSAAILQRQLTLTSR